MKIYHVWATKWDIYLGSGNHILCMRLLIFKILFRSPRSISNDKRSRAIMGHAMTYVGESRVRLARQLSRVAFPVSAF